MSATPRTQSIFNDLVKQNYGHASIEVAIKEVEQLETELAEALAEIERLRGELIRQIQPEEYVLSTYSATAEPNAKDKLIKQMREALKLLLEGAIHDFHYACQRRDNCLCWGCQKARVKVALSAAERGE